MYNLPFNPYRQRAIEEAKKLKNEKQGGSADALFRNDADFLQIAKKIARENSNINLQRLKEFYDQIIKDDKELLAVDEETKQIYVKLLNFQVPQKAIERLKEIGGSVQYIRGNDEKQSKIVNMDYFSVRIDKMPTFGGQLLDAGMLFKKIRDNFLTLSKGSKVFESNCREMTMKGYWEFKPYPKNPKEELNRWEKQLGGSIFKIEAKSEVDSINIPNIGNIRNPNNIFRPPKDPADHGAVLESEISPQNSWIFTTVFTPESDTQPFSGHRQFGIHKDKEGNYRFFARAIDRIWPSEFILKFNEKECSVKDYLIIADATWNNLIKNVSKFIRENGGKTTIMPSEINRRIDFNIFFKKFRSNKPVNFVGNIEQYK